MNENVRLTAWVRGRVQGVGFRWWTRANAMRIGGLDGYAGRIRTDREPSGELLHAQFAEKGGRFYVCPICFNERDLDDGELVFNAELKGATPLMEFAGDDAMTFTY